MGNSVNIGLFNNQAEQREVLKGVIEQTHGLDLVLDTSRWEELEAALIDGLVGIMLVNLDDDVEFGEQIVQRILRTVPDMSVVGVSRQGEPTTIISAMRAGCSQFVCAPIDPEDFRNAVDRIRATRMAVPHKSQRICVVGASGGVGCTTISCNLAMELAQVSNCICALVDMNLEYGDAALAFDCEPKYSFADLCESGSPIDRTIVESAMHLLPCNVALLSRPNKVADARVVTPEGAEQTLKVLGRTYRYVVIDLPRAFGFLSSVALTGADHIMIVAQLAIPSIRNASRVYDLLLEMGAKEENIEIVLNRCRAEHERISPEDVEQHFRRPVFALIPNDYRRVTAALDFGHPIMADSPNSPARLAIHELAKTIAQDRRTREGGVLPASSKGLFKRWWGGSKQQATAPHA